ncbi:MAG TPA: DUF1788 domain-containing protein [Syntrophales bacterium]|nr:DUF1788 domain-containing protein [Syntrophales bacterium]
MNELLKERLNKIMDRIQSPEFLSNSGLGNEIGFYIFDYPPEEELVVREYVKFVLDTLAKKRPNLRIAHVNLFRLLVDYLKQRNLYDRALNIQKTKGDAELRKALKGPLHEEKIAGIFVEAAQPENNDVVFMTGVGNVWPLFRSHTLLNNLHPLMQGTPLVIFYPGVYDGQGLSLFGRLRDNNYYRAFRLIP